MSTLIADIRPVTTNGPAEYTFEVDGTLQNAVAGKTMSQALDDIKALVVAAGGTIDRIHIVVATH